MKITFDEFRELVKANFAKDMDDLSAEEIEEYLNDEESIEVMRHEYDMSAEQLKNGEITEQIFRNGSVSAAASTLELLY